MKRSINLMPDSSVRRRMTSETAWMWGRVLVATSVVAGAMGLIKAWQREDARQRTAALTAQHQPIEQLRSDLKVLRARINAVQAGEALALSIADAPPVLSVLAGAVDAARAFQGEAYISEVAYESDAETGPAEPGRLVIEGVARDPAAIGRLVDALQASDRFSEVRLGDTEARLLRGTATTAFEVECSL